MAIRVSKSGLGRAQQFDFLFNHFPNFLSNQAEKRGKKIELETNIETEIKANSSPYLVRRVINFPKTPNPETITNAYLKRANITPPSPRKHSES
jgi:hypothetical protein